MKKMKNDPEKFILNWVSNLTFQKNLKMFINFKLAAKTFYCCEPGFFQIIDSFSDLYKLQGVVQKRRFILDESCTIVGKCEP